MERLTKTYSDGTHGANDNLPCGENSYTYKGLLLESLGKYEDLEEQGLLLRLPCKVGDTVYVLCKNIVTEKQVYDVQYRGGITYQKGQRWYVNIGGVVYYEMDFGKTVFLTKAEAEQKLKEIVQVVEREYNGGWIPCSERLPEEAFGCLVTVMDCEPSTQTDFENILPYFVGYDGETWNDIDGNVIPFEVIAWMPLPQPYQYDIGKTDSSKMRSQNKS